MNEEEKTALKEMGLDGRTKTGKEFLATRRKEAYEKENKERKEAEEKRKEEKIHTVQTIDTIADASSIGLFSEDGNMVTFRSICGDGDMHVRLLKYGVFSWEDIPDRYDDFDIRMKGSFFLSYSDCRNRPIAKLTGWIAVYRCCRTFCILADEIEMVK